MKLIKLHQVELEELDVTGEEWYINPDKINFLSVNKEVLKPCTRIFCDNGAWIQVKETPEEIIKLIGEN